MNIFGFRPFKGKFNLGNSDDIPSNNDGTLIGAIKQINTHLSVFSFRDNEGQAQYSMDNGDTWTDFKHPAGTLSITANGTYNVADYASASVNVPSGPSASKRVDAASGYWNISSGYFANITSLSKLTGTVTQSGDVQSYTSGLASYTANSNGTYNYTLRTACYVNGTYRSSGYSGTYNYNNVVVIAEA